jgi:hypothetical protein
MNPPIACFNHRAKMLSDSGMESQIDIVDAEDEMHRF